ERVDLARKHGLEIFTIATHLQGQVLGDEPSVKTLQFLKPGEARAAYKAWRDKGHNPPRTDPYFVPEEIGKLVHSEAKRDLLACVRYAGHLSKLQNRKVALPGFVGSPAHCWSQLVLFPAAADQLRGPQHPRRAPGQPRTARRALRADVRAVQAVRRHVRPGVPSVRTGDGRHRVGDGLPRGDGPGRLRGR